jgi:hypothetical protein
MLLPIFEAITVDYLVEIGTSAGRNWANLPDKA